MAGIKISELAPGIPSLTDIVPASDMVDAPPTTKKYLQSDLAEFYKDYIAPSVQGFLFNAEVATGVDDAFVVTLDPAPTLQDGMLVVMNSGTLVNNTDSPTLQLNALPPKPIVTAAGSPAPGDILQDSVYLFAYNGTDDNFFLINPLVSTPNTYFIQRNFYNFAGDGGIADAYVATTVPFNDDIDEAFALYLRVANTNTGASTITVNGITKDIVRNDGSALLAGDMAANRTAYLLYDQALDKFVLINPDAATTSVYVQSVTGTANEIDVDNTDPQNPVASLSSTINVPGTLTIQASTVIDSIIDDDTFATATDSNIPTAESVKAYVDGLDGGSVKSVTGTTNEIDVNNTDPQNPVLSLSATLDFPGTFTAQGTVSIDEIIDDDTFATATDSNLPTAESVKAYVDGLDGGSVKSVTGTANQIDVNNTDAQNPVLSLPATTVFPGTARAGNILINGNTISSENVDGDINLAPNGLGNLVLDGTNWPQTSGTNGYFLQTNGAGQASWQPASSSVSGAWVPTLLGSTTAGTPTYVAQVGSYTKSGDMVTVWFRVIISDLGGMAGNFWIGGLPFPIDFAGRLSLGTVTNLENMTDYYPMVLLGVTGTEMGLYNGETYNAIATPVSAGSNSMLVSGFLLYQTS